MTDEQKQTTLNGFEETQEGWTAKPVVGGTPLHGESCLKSHVLPALRKHPERVCSLVARGRSCIDRSLALLSLFCSTRLGCCRAGIRAGGCRIWHSVAHSGKNMTGIDFICGSGVWKDE
ncbi:hypothetical protein CEXT_346671 [Caerostris extrusa]|uniref:Uncharacterized protein n=1 Tax=Caerostris extrusa TaxID=172846 RepID=A0AAV4NZW8_CAEEX|nr:hypothetical protein CEXT_346671 [Caerostris extrusa]